MLVNTLINVNQWHLIVKCYHYYYYYYNFIVILIYNYKMFDQILHPYYFFKICFHFYQKNLNGMPKKSAVYQILICPTVYCIYARVTEVIPSPVIIRLTRSERVLVAFVYYDQAICLQYAGRDARNFFMYLSLGWRRDGVIAAHYSRHVGKLVNGGAGHTLVEILTAHVSICLIMPYFSCI